MNDKELAHHHIIRDLQAMHMDIKNDVRKRSALIRKTDHLQAVDKRKLAALSRVINQLKRPEDLEG